MNARRRCYNDGSFSHGVETLIVCVVILWTVVFILNTVPYVNARCGNVLIIAEYVFVGFFTAEYIIRFFRAYPKRAYVFSFYGVIDFLAIAPFYIGLPFSAMLRVVRVLRFLRVLRILRVMKLMRVTTALESFLATGRRIAFELGVFYLIIAILLMFSATGIYYAESSKQPQVFSSIPASFWWAIATLTTVGYGDTYPQTNTGKIFASCIMLLGIGFIAIPAGLFAAAFVKGDRRMKPIFLRDHIVICGWNASGKEVLNELIAGAGNTDIAIIANLEENPADTDKGGTQFLKGDCTNEDVLRHAAVEYARTAIVLADTSAGRSYDEADARTILTVLTIDAINPAVYTCAELVHGENRVHLERVHVDEVIVSGEYAGKVLAHSALFHGLSHVFGNLLTKTADTSEFYRVPIPAVIVGGDFEAVHSYFRENHRAIAVALVRNGRPLVNPEFGFRTEQGDEIIVIAQEKPDL